MIEINNFSFASWTIFIGVLVWGLRLTTNWITDFKGFSHEDFRYVDFRKKFKKLYWFVSYAGVHMFPTLIVYMSLYPIYYVLTNNVSSSSFVIVGSIIMILGAIISYIADEQLREHKKKRTGTSIMSGLWRFSRHPNYFGEVLFWFGAAVTSISIAIEVVPFLGFIAMVLLFNLYSVPKMEQKLLNNKADYQFVVDNVPRFFLNPLKAYQDDLQLEE